jgi:adenine-specific DNA-methyltransferase
LEWGCRNAEQNLSRNCHPVFLLCGFPLTATVSTVGDATRTAIWRVIDEEQEKAFTICLADQIDLEMVKTLGLTKADLFVCRDTALDDTVAANLALQCTLKVL